MSCLTMGNGIPIPDTAAYRKRTGQPISSAGSQNPLDLSMGSVNNAQIDSKHYAGISGRLYDSRESAMAAYDGFPNESECWYPSDFGPVYIDENGMHSNTWLVSYGSKFYLDKNGSCTIGYATISGASYYFDKCGRLAYNRRTPNGLYAGSDGILYENALITIEDIDLAFTWPFMSENDKNIVLRAISYALSKQGCAYSRVRRFEEDFFDCSSLVYRAYKDAGLDIGSSFGTTAAAEAQNLQRKCCHIPPENIQPGDLIFYQKAEASDRYKSIGHVSMYIGSGMEIEAAGEKYGILVHNADVDSAYMICRPILLTRNCYKSKNPHADLR